MRVELWKPSSQLDFCLERTRLAKHFIFTRWDPEVIMGGLQQLFFGLQL
jgi:hypothetical protein